MKYQHFRGRRYLSPEQVLVIDQNNDCGERRPMTRSHDHAGVANRNALIQIRGVGQTTYSGTNYSNNLRQ